MMQNFQTVVKNAVIIICSLLLRRNNFFEMPPRRHGMAATLSFFTPYLPIKPMRAHASEPFSLSAIRKKLTGKTPVVEASIDRLAEILENFSAACPFASLCR
jgi:hypothetical protein